MKTTKLFFALLAMIAFNATLFGQNLNGNGGQNGDAVISEVQVYDLGNGTGLVEVRVSGNLANTVTGGSFSTPENCLVCGSGILIVEPSGNVPGNRVVLTGGFSLAPAIGNQPRFVDLDIEVYGENFRQEARQQRRAIRARN